MHRTRGADACPRDRRGARGTATETGAGSASPTEVRERNVRQVSLDAGPEGPLPEPRGPGPKAASPSTGLDRLPKSQVRLCPAVGSGDPRPFLPGCPEGQTPPGQATDRRRASPGPKTLGARAWPGCRPSRGPGPGSRSQLSPSGPPKQPGPGRRRRRRSSESGPAEPVPASVTRATCCTTSGAAESLRTRQRQGAPPRRLLSDPRA